MTANETFFQRKQAAAVLKHGILSRYPRVFATMTGSTSVGGRVVYLDGYAGPGRYEPESGQDVGAPGSPLLAVQTAATVAQWARSVCCVFVEKDPGYAANLRRVLGHEATNSLSYKVLEGNLEDRLDEALAVAGESPLLAFLDPFGTALPYEQMLNGLLRRGEGLKTEVLLNFNLESVRRIGGLLAGTETDPEQTAGGRSATLQRIDRFLGEGWWRETFREARQSGGAGSAAKAALLVATEFCKRVEADAGFKSFPVPIRRRPDHHPLFLMILFYRHPAAPYMFNDSASGANKDWRDHFRQADLAEELAKQELQPDLFGADFTREVSDGDARRIEGQLDEAWIGIIATNIRNHSAVSPVMPVETRFGDLYGTTLGLAREKHLRAAWDRLADERLIEPRDTQQRLRRQSIVRLRSS